MDATQQQFRTAGFGGFHKQDVLQYIESSVRAQEEQTAETQAELSRLTRERDAAQAQADEYGARVAALEEELRQCRQTLEQTAQERETARGEVTRLTERLSVLEAHVAQIEPLAQTYEQVKDRTAGVELEAHRRARAIEEEAMAQVRRTKAEVRVWADKVQMEYDRMRAELDGALKGISGDFGKMRERLQVISGTMGTEDTNLKNILRPYREPEKAREQGR
ncbi:MAG: hypothetical protein LIO58_06835 [Oscillospiraceae bacterium]|nr:hypothetical protein [Oscillospiraceae bacterium]